MSYSQIESLCLFCATKCCPKFLIECDGKLTTFKPEPDSVGLFSRHDYENRAVIPDESLVIEQDLKAIFIVGQLLNIPQNYWVQYLAKHNGQCRPGLWFPVCELCDTVVQQCYECSKEIRTLERALENGKRKLKGNIFKSVIIETELNENDQSVRKHIRKKVNEEITVQRNIQRQNEHKFDSNNDSFKTVTTTKDILSSTYDNDEGSFISDEFESENNKDGGVYCPQNEIPLITTKISFSSPVDTQMTSIRRSKRTLTKSQIIKRQLSTQNLVQKKHKTIKSSLKMYKKRRSTFIKMNPTSNKTHNWCAVTLTDAQLEKDWRVFSSFNFPHYKLVTYYCYHGGRKCGSRLKKRISHNSDEVIMEINNVQHSNHRNRQMMSAEQKKLIIDTLEVNIKRPNNILAVFKRQNMDPPDKAQLRNFLARLRKKKLLVLDKPHACDTCGKKFRTLFSLHQHQKTYHCDTDKDNTSEKISTPSADIPIRKRGRPKLNSDHSQPIAESKPPPTKTHMKRHSWTVITPTDDYLEKNWRICSAQKLSDCKLVTYYCYFGGSKCPARLKKRIFYNSTEAILETNNAEHLNHREKTMFTQDQKQLVLTCLNDGIDQPNSILSVFKEKDTTPPTLVQLKNFLSRLRQKDLVRNSSLGDGLFLSRKKIREGKEPYQCEHCDKICKSIMTLELHQSTIHANELGITPLICEDCGFSTGSTRFFQLHKRSKCPGLKSIKVEFICPICTQVFKHKRNLEMHMKSLLHKDAGEDSPQHFHYADGAYVCNYCGDRMSKGVSLAAHMSSKHWDKTKIEFRCEGCSTLFEKPRLLWNHRKICHDLGGDDANKTMDSCPKNDVKMYPCKHCPMEFNSTVGRLEHKKTAHAEICNQHMCDSCGVTLTSMYLLNKHKMVCGNAKAPAETLNRKSVRKRKSKKNDAEPEPKLSDPNP